MRKKERLLQTILGSFLLGLGIVFAIASTWGPDPLSYLWAGISARYGISIGIANIIVTILLGIVVFVFEPKQMGLGTILSPFVIGLTIDGILPHFPMASNTMMSALFIIIGIYLYTLGVALYILQDLGRTTYDGVIYVLSHRLNINQAISKTIIDSMIVILALSLKTPIQIGPVFFAIFAGNLMVKHMNFINKHKGKR